MTLPDVPAVVPPAAPAKKLRRPVLIGIIAGGLVVLLGLGAAAFALVNFLTGAGQSASASAVAFPASTLYWSEFVVDPSAAQRLEAVRFVTAMDSLQDALEDSDLDLDFDDLASNGDLQESLWNFFVDGDNAGIDTDLDYDDDIRPWIGSRISVGLLPTDDFEEPCLIIAIEARDIDAGIEAAEQFVDDIDVDADVSSHNGYVVVATGDVDLDDVYDDGTLDDSERFAAVARGAGSQGVASFYVDLGALYGMVNEATTGDYTDVQYWKDEIESNYYGYIEPDDYEYIEDCPDVDSTESDDDSSGDGDYDYDYYCEGYYLYNGETYENYDDFAQEWVRENVDELAEQKVSEYEDLAQQQQAVVESLDGTTAFVVARFADASFELSGIVGGVKDMEPVKVGGDDESKLPASTIALLSVSGLAESLDRAFSDENLGASGGVLSPLASGGNSTLSRDDVEDWFDESLGVDFPDDLTDLLGSKVQVVFDGDIDLDELGNASDSSVVGDVAETGAAIIITTNDADATVSAWEDLLENAEERIDGKLDVDVEHDGNRVIISGGDYLDTVLDPDERLGDLEAFRRAVPQHSGANAMLYLDVAELVDMVSDVTGSNDSFEFLDGLQAVGITSTVTSADSYAFTLRVTTDAD